MKMNFYPMKTFINNCFYFLSVHFHVRKITFQAAGNYRMFPARSLMKELSRLTLSGLILISGFILHAQEITSVGTNEKQWEYQLRFKPTKWPEWLIGSNYDVTTFSETNSGDQTLLLILENIKGVTGYTDAAAVVLSKEGKIIKQSNNLTFFNDLQGIKSVKSDPQGNFWISVIQEKESFLYCYTPDLQLKFKISTPPADIYFVHDQMLLAFNNTDTSFFNRLTKAGYLPENMLNNCLKAEEDFSILIVDYRNFHIQKCSALPVEGFVSKTFLEQMQDGSYFLISNIVILNGPDHHDVNMYHFDKSGQLLTTRILKGESMLTHLYVLNASQNEQDQLVISGWCDSPVDFEKPGIFMPEMYDSIITVDSLGMEDGFNYEIHYPMSQLKEVQSKYTDGSYRIEMVLKNTFTCAFSTAFELVSYQFVKKDNFYFEENTTKSKFVEVYFDEPEAGSEIHPLVFIRKR